MTDYACFVENNDHEGETWRFYIPIEENEEAIVWLKERLDEMDDNWCYSFEDDCTEVEVDVLIRKGGSGYMNYHNQLEGILNIDDIKGVTDEKLDQVLYKGGIENMME